jgi:hypothetical protein
MANEFVARNGVIALSNSQITGSLTVTDSITGSLFGTASFATNALTASYAGNVPETSSFSVTASYAISASQAINSNNASTASYINQLNQNVSISGSVNISQSINVPVVNTPLVQNGSQYIAQDTNTSITAIQNGSYAWRFYPGGTLQPAGAIVGSTFDATSVDVTQNVLLLKSLYYGAQIITAPDGVTTKTWSFKTDGDLEIPTGRYITGSLLGTASYATQALNASTASYVLNAVSASFATNANNATTASYVLNAVSASFATNATNASTASYVLNAVSASYALNATNALTASYFVTSSVTSASYALNATNASTASYVLNAISASYALSSSFSTLADVSTNSTIGSTTSNTTRYLTFVATGTGNRQFDINTTKFIVNAATGSMGINKSTITSGYNLDVAGNTLISGSLLVTGSITAQTLIVQTVSSSVVYSSGSNIFGNTLSNTQIFTGSVLITGSQNITGSLTVGFGGSKELEVLPTGITVGNLITDTHRFTGSVQITGSLNLNGNQTSSGSLTLFGPNNNTPNIRTQNSSLILEGNAGLFSSFGSQLRITANQGAWTDNVTSSYFQIKTTGSFGSNNYVTFQGGTWASDAPFDRLQFASYYTSFNNGAYGTTPVPTASVEIINSNSGTIPLLQLKTLVGQTSNYVNITSGSTAGNVFNITKDGVVAISTTNTSTEANLFLGAKGTDEGGQLFLQKGTSQNSASMLDNYQDQFRVLTGTDTTSNRSDLILSHVTRNLTVYGDVIAYGSSDKRLKENIQPIENALDKLDKIGGYTFDWDDKIAIHGHEGHDIGVIAQEIEEVLPEVVTTRDNGYKAVKYEKIVPFLIQCIKELKDEIRDLKSQK